MTHTLKCDPAPFRAVQGGQKTCEVRVNDREFSVGDRLMLLEYDRETQDYTGGKCHVLVTHIVEGGSYGLPPDLCVLSICRFACLPEVGK